MDALETAAEPDPAKIADIDVRVWVERLGELRCPVLAVAGDLDVSDVAQTANHLAAHAPNARAIVWPHVAHMIGMEVPDEFAAVIIDFLAPLPRWS